MYCPSCGTQNDSDYQYCYACGKPLPKVPAPGSPQPAPIKPPQFDKTPVRSEPAAQPGRTKWILIGGVAALVLIAAVLILAGMFGGTEQAAPPDMGTVPQQPWSGETLVPPVPAATATPTVILPTQTLEPSLTPTATTIPTETPEPGSRIIIPKDGFVMVYVPAGEFQMGCHPEHNGGQSCYFDELPLHPNNSKCGKKDVIS